MLWSMEDIEAIENFVTEMKNVLKVSQQETLSLVKIGMIHFRNCHRPNQLQPSRLTSYVVFVSLIANAQLLKVLVNRG